MQTACFVQTIKERCRVCYTCVRECPAKAIGISDGQAHVIAERCIGCGNCARVCSQGAKKVLDGTQQVARLLHQGSACRGASSHRVSPQNLRSASTKSRRNAAGSGLSLRA